MSRTSLLRSAQKGRNEIAGNTQSIHKFEGFQLIEARRVIWPGFELELNFEEEVDEFITCFTI